jgi:hypothetical protein
MMPTDHISNPAYQLLNWKDNTGTIPSYNFDTEEVLVQFEDGSIGHTLAPQNYNWSKDLVIYGVLKYAIVPKGYRSCNPNLVALQLPAQTISKCSACGLELNKVMGYVCPRMDCPTFPVVTC